ncbi:MAG: hypothetical protein ACYS9X_32185 [Planctomycetota bacterium]|jgi:hypothetical protein
MRSLALGAALFALPVLHGCGTKEQDSADRPTEAVQHDDQAGPASVAKEVIDDPSWGGARLLPSAPPAFVPVYPPRSLVAIYAHGRLRQELSCVPQQRHIVFHGARPSVGSADMVGSWCLEVRQGVDTIWRLTAQRDLAGERE